MTQVDKTTLHTVRGIPTAMRNHISMGAIINKVLQQKCRFKLVLENNQFSEPINLLQTKRKKKKKKNFLSEDKAFFIGLAAPNKEAKSFSKQILTI